MTLQKFLEDTAQVLADHDEAVERLHSTKAGAAAPAVSFGALGPPRARNTPLPNLRLASLPGPSHRQALQRFANAGAAKRQELVRRESVKLFSIIFAQYRPGPAFLAGHDLASNALDAKITPGGITWRERLAALAVSPAAFGKNLAILARQCPRLDTGRGVVTGSGFLLQDGSIMTARHVVQAPGNLFGTPPRPARVRYNQVNTAIPRDAEIAVTAELNPGGGVFDMAILGQAQDWQATLAASPLAAEFGVPAGLPLQTEALAEAELKNRPVAVIGHPLSGNAGGDPADIAIVYGDAQLGLKRFMPGSLDDAQPLLTENSQTFLAHDCSTLGGASGGCLVDLLTGRVLGIHISGNATLTNRAVPIWVLPGLTSAANLSSPNES